MVEPNRLFTSVHENDRNSFRIGFQRDVSAERIGAGCNRGSAGRNAVVTNLDARFILDRWEVSTGPDERQTGVLLDETFDGQRYFAGFHSVAQEHDRAMAGQSTGVRNCFARRTPALGVE